MEIAAVKAEATTKTGPHLHTTTPTPTHSGADPEGGFGDLSPINFLEVKIIINV